MNLLYSKLHLANKQELFSLDGIFLSIIAANTAVSLGLTLVSLGLINATIWIAAVSCLALAFAVNPRKIAKEKNK